MSPDARQIVAVRDVFEALGPDAARRVTLLWPALVGPAEGAPLHLRAHANRELVRAALVDARRSDIALEAQAIAQRVADEGKVLRQLRSGAMLAYAEGSALRDLIAVPVTEPFAQRMDLRGRIRLYLSLLADRPVPAGPAGVAPVDPSDAAGVSSPGTCTHDAAETLGDGARHVPTTADAQAFRQPAGRRRTLLEFSAAGRGRVVELVGELGPGTDRLAVLVPGTGSGLYGYHLPHETCEDLVAADPEHRTAAVCWVGTDFPMGLLNESAQTRFALDGAPALVNTLVSLRLALAAQESETTCGGSGAAGTYSSPDTQSGHDAAVDGVDKSGRAHRRPEPDRTDHADYRPETDHTGRVNHDPESDGTKRAAHRATDPGQNGARAREPLVTVIGHSYGASLVGAAERLGLPTDQVVHLASAGAGPGVRSVRDYAQVDALGRDRAVERFACTAPGDPIRWLFGGDAPSSSRTPPAAEGAGAPPAPDGSYAPSASKSPRIPRIPRRRRYALVPRRAPGCGRWPEARRRLGLRGVIRAALSGLSRAAVHTRDDLFRGDRTTPPSSVVAEPSEFSLWARFPQRQHPLVSEIRTRLSGLHLRWVGPLGADPARLAGMHSYEAGEWEAARRGAQPGEPVAGPLGHLGVITPGTTAFRRLSSIVSRR